jgi:hypothetical protein
MSTTRCQGEAPRGFVMAKDKGLNCPVVLCERCGTEITNIKMGGVAFPWLHHPGDVARPVVLCQMNRCLSAPEYRDWPWMELGEYLSRLLHNLGALNVTWVGHEQRRHTAMAGV